MAKPISERGPGKFRQLRDYRPRKKPSAAVTVYFVDPTPRMNPSDAAELRARVGDLPPSALRGTDPQTALGNLRGSDAPRE